MYRLEREERAAESGVPRPNRKVQSCLKNPMKFEGDTRNRSDDVMQREYRWSPDLDVMRYYHAKWVVNQHRWSSQEQRQ